VRTPTPAPAAVFNMTICVDFRFVVAGGEVWGDVLWVKKGEQITLFGNTQGNQRGS